jgi:hypothetical protein
MTAERVNQLLVLLPDSALPDDLTAWLAVGLAGWQRGQCLEDALRLTDDDSDDSGMDLYERDDLLRAAIRLCPGDSETAQASYFLEVIEGHLLHPDPTGARFVDMLHSARVYIPKTLRHLRRILAGRRQDGWRERDTGKLCPSVSRFNTGGTFTKREPDDGKGKLF